MTADTSGMETAGDLTLVPCGGRWDAVKVPRWIAVQALKQLKGKHGAVIVDPRERALYFLVPPQSTSGWTVQYTSPLSTASYVAVPPSSKESGPGVYWLTSPVHGPVHTRTGLLRVVIEETLGPQMKVAL
ncbi:hypothetical protein [Streptomyces barkulensis]|uniref:hypothetical protein n=1 Tax=Streptomyces barkulensis TaxID=1257026 RepID=UPI0011811E3C|nr:hypothetical protein [Streptomyces barkulensis]